MVRVEVEGQAASAASLLAMAGDVRRIDKSGAIMVHLPYLEGGAFNFRNIETLKRYLHASADRLAAYYTARTGQPAATPALDQYHQDQEYGDND